MLELTNKKLRSPIKGIRFANFIGDLFCFWLIIILNTLLLDNVLGILHEGSAALGVLHLIIYLIYYVFFEFKFGKTPAKFLTNTIVVDKNGQQPTLKIIIIRSLCRIIPFEPLSFLLNQDWHDKISKTFVVLNDK